MLQTDNIIVYLHTKEVSEPLKLSLLKVSLDVVMKQDVLKKDPFIE
jgi:hypothetical protein